MVQTQEKEHKKMESEFFLKNDELLGILVCSSHIFQRVQLFNLL